LILDSNVEKVFYWLIDNPSHQPYRQEGGFDGFLI